MGGEEVYKVDTMLIAKSFRTKHYASISLEIKTKMDGKKSFLLPQGQTFPLNKLYNFEFYHFHLSIFHDK